VPRDGADRLRGFGRRFRWLRGVGPCAGAAARLLGAAAALLASVGEELSPVYVLSRDRVEAALHAGLDDAVFTTAWREGESMAADGGERAVAYALDEGT